MKESGDEGVGRGGGVGGKSPRGKPGGSCTECTRKVGETKRRTEKDSCRKTTGVALGGGKKNQVGRLREVALGRGKKRGLP